MIAELAPTLSGSASPRLCGESVFSFSITTEDALQHAAAVPHEEIEAARTLLSALKHIHEAPKILPECKRIAAGLTLRGWSAERLRSKYYEYINGTKDYPAGDWRICLNKARARIAHCTKTLSLKHRPLFIEFWRGLGERWHQDWAAAHDDLLLIWRTRHDTNRKFYASIPGYSAWPVADAGGEHPDGWSYANLMRYQSDPYDQIAARIGHAKALQHRLPVLTSRYPQGGKPLAFGQFLEFDDHEFNQWTLFQKKQMRPLGFGCLEVLSACICHVGLKPKLWDFEDEKKVELSEREFLWFALSVLMTHGYRADVGTTLIGERAKSKLPTWLIERLESVTNGKLKWFVGGRFGKPAHAGQWEGRSKGNFRTKRLIEGSWRMVDDQTAAIPAQTGRNRDDAPEGFAPGAGAHKYTGQIIRAAQAALRTGRITEDQLGQIQFAVPHYTLWAQLALDAITRVNRDHTHDLEGWERLGFVQPKWRLPSSENWLDWQDYLALPDTERGVVKAMLERTPELVRPHRLSRQDVFDAHKKHLTPLAWELLPGLVGEGLAIRDSVPVNAGMVKIECAEIDPDPLEFYARDHRSGHYLPNGTHYQPFLNPYAPTHLVLCDAQGRVAAVCERYVRPLRSDTEAVQKLMGEQQHYEALARQRLNHRHRDEAEAKQAMIDGNKKILGLDPAVPRGKLPPPPPAPVAPADDCTAEYLAKENAETPAGPDQTPSWE